MSGRAGLGELEHLALLATVRLGEDAYAVRIVDEIEDRTGRALGHASIYVVLGRLEKKGLLSSRLGAPAPERGGRPRRFYRATPRAIEQLRANRRALVSLWDGVEAVRE